MPTSYLQQLSLFFISEQVLVPAMLLVYVKSIIFLALLLKQCSELGRLYPQHLAPATFWYDNFLSQSQLSRFAHKIYSLTFRVRTLALALLIFGIYTDLAYLFLFISYLCELRCLARQHVVFALVTMLVIYLDPVWSDSLTVAQILIGAPSPMPEIVSAPGIIFIKTLLLVIYPISAIRKARRNFQSGVVLAQSAKISIQAEGRRFPDHYFNLTKTLLGALLPRYSVLLSYATIVLQLVIPLLLVSGGLATYLGVGLGCALHVGMTLLFPITLAPFTFMVFAHYLLWL